MDRVSKALRRLPRARRQELLALIEQIEKGAVAKLDIAKLKGYRSLFRIRQGGLRIIVKNTDDEFRVVLLEGRPETTYKDLGKFDT